MILERSTSSRKTSFDRTVFAGVNEPRRAITRPSWARDVRGRTTSQTDGDNDDEVGDREDNDKSDEDDDDDDDEVEHCAICSSPIHNKTVVTPCLHSLFCWKCIRAWSDQSRKASPFKELIYNIRSNKDFQTHHLVPLRSPSTTTAAEDHRRLAGTSSRHASSSSTSHRRPSVTSLPRYALYGRRSNPDASPAPGIDQATWREQVNERALERRRFVYRHGLFAKHVASNRYTGFKPFGPEKLNNNAFKNKVLVFVRRELQVFPSVDIAFLTTYILSIASQIDLRSAAAIRLLADFVPQEQAEHLAHEIVTFARSPFDKLEDYDRFVQYGRPEKVEIPRSDERERQREPRFGKMVENRRGWEAQNGRYDRGDEDTMWARRGSYDRKVDAARYRNQRADEVRYRDRSRDGYDDDRNRRRRSPSAEPPPPVLAARPPPRAPSRRDLDAPPSRPSSQRSNLDPSRTNLLGAPITPGAHEESSDVLSLFGTPLRESTPPPPTTKGTTSSNPGLAAQPNPEISARAAQVSLSIFGIAKSAQPIIDTAERTHVQHSKSTIDEVATLDSTATDSPVSTTAPVVPSANLKPIPNTISREILQSRLMAEYRTGLSNKSNQPSPSTSIDLSPPSATPSSPPRQRTTTNWAARGQLAARGFELKQRLMESRQKAMWEAQQQEVSTSQGSPVGVAGDEPMTPSDCSWTLSYDIPSLTTTMIYSDAKRLRLLERLEEEKRFVANDHDPSSTSHTSVKPERSKETDLAAEANLRRTLQVQRSEKKAKAKALGDRAMEWKERLFKARLMKERKGRGEGG
ncbi:BQ2448_7214 [Microbotryum intermedium]|uniref:RING-type E3 ubiquitin transferase n=1 Tax=Microbotryum intermedium TaxID=269621 RepID=A0A238FQ12_9BASI|nr:BQ2448_7214 [Microbotryum intermedium]